MPKYLSVDDLFIAKYKDKFNLLIVTATAIEQKVLHENLKPLPGQDCILKITNQQHTYYLGIFGVFFAVHVSCAEMGSIGRGSSIVTTMDAITAWSPSVLIMIGIAFGVDETNQKIGDILVSERIYSYEPEKVGESEDGETTKEYRGKEAPASALLVDRFKQVTGWDYQVSGHSPKIIIGTILSGEKLVDYAGFKAELLKQCPEAKGGEMEGAGLFSACDQKVSHVVLVKGICDFAENKGLDKDVKQDTAIKSATSLCEHVFSEEFSFKDAQLVKNDEVLSTDFKVEHGGIPGWMITREQLLKKEIRHED